MLLDQDEFFDCHFAGDDRSNRFAFPPKLDLFGGCDERLGIIPIRNLCLSNQANGAGVSSGDIIDSYRFQHLQIIF